MCQNILHWVATIEQWHRNLTAPAMRIQEYDRAAAAAQIQFGAELALQIQARDSADQVKLLARQNASLKRKLELVALCAVILAFPRGRQLLPPHGIYMELGRALLQPRPKERPKRTRRKKAVYCHRPGRCYLWTFRYPPMWRSHLIPSHFLFSPDGPSQR
ncbi:hypothetical protein FIBSPDRAFT_531767 [Athelia psychrophila]|uniref:Uncharacterized protein n=1 Tax=Athelia psychrophila TaxID=1759441 RepID=A0A167TIK2_9AGAM|nr:hypothetical protein FIBSPDRAFT_531767 [Fibularhizoctonia sp. CBS 109695]